MAASSRQTPESSTGCSRIQPKLNSIIGAILGMMIILRPFVLAGWLGGWRILFHLSFGLHELKSELAETLKRSAKPSEKHKG